MPLAAEARWQACGTLSYIGALREPRASYPVKFTILPSTMSATATTRTLRRARPLLLIEPAAALRPVLVKMLEGAGYVLTVTADWHEGLASAGGDFELIILGWKGGTIDASAIAMIEQLRAKRRLPVVVLLSAQECRALSNRALAPGIWAAPRLELLDEIRRLRNRAMLAAGRALDDVSHAPRRMPTPLPRTPTPLPADQAAAPADASARARPASSTVPLTPDQLAAQARQDLPGLVAERTLSEGTVVDKYRIERLVGQGGFAHVYRATHLVLNMPIALKMLKGTLAEAQPHVIEGFCTEARNAIRISHPNVVRVHDVTRSGSMTYLVMEWIDGLSLADVIKTTGSLPVNDAIKIGIAVCEGLEAALAYGIIHRDVKPGNILLANNGAVKLVDFGLAMNMRHGPDSTELEFAPLVGTPAYMSPEQAISPGSVDSRSDIYALGATLFHACAGRTPYFGDDPFQMLLQHRDQPIPDLAREVDDYLPEFAGLVTRMLAKDKDLRFSSLAQLRGHLQDLHRSMVREGVVQNNGWSSVYLRRHARAAVSSRGD